MTITPVVNSGSDTQIENVSGNVFYYGVRSTFNDVGTAVFDGTGGFYRRDVTLRQSEDPTGADNVNWPNSICFNVSSNSARADGKQLLVTVSPGGTGVNKPYPIASAGGVACNENNCQDFSTDSTGTGSYHAAHYTENTALRICLYPREICMTLMAQGNGCTSDGFVDAKNGQPAHIPLYFEIKSAEKGSTGPPTSTTSPDTTGTSNYRMALQTNPPAIACPVLSQVYFPGDGEILLNTTGFGNALATSPSSAPAVALVVVARLEPANVDDSIAGFRSGNDVVKGIPIGSNVQPVEDFENTTDGIDKKYNVSFLMRDAAGMLASPQSLAIPGSCRLTGVQTSEIPGFLTESKCFIATAAFRSGEAESVRLLRVFRDEVLLKYGPGREFVEWYYAWSPKSAEWLLRNPVFRLPILAALLPVQLLAWLMLHSAVLFGAGFLGLLCIGWAIQARFLARWRSNGGAL